MNELLCSELLPAAEAQASNAFDDIQANYIDKAGSDEAAVAFLSAFLRIVSQVLGGYVVSVMDDDALLALRKLRP